MNHKTAIIGINALTYGEQAATLQQFLQQVGGTTLLLLPDEGNEVDECAVSAWQGACRVGHVMHRDASWIGPLVRRCGSINAQVVWTDAATPSLMAEVDVEALSASANGTMGVVSEVQFHVPACGATLVPERCASFPSPPPTSAAVRCKEWTLPVPVAIPRSASILAQLYASLRRYVDGLQPWDTDADALLQRVLHDDTFDLSAERSADRRALASYLCRHKQFDALARLNKNNSLMTSAANANGPLQCLRQMVQADGRVQCVWHDYRQQIDAVEQALNAFPLPFADYLIDDPRLFVARLYYARLPFHLLWAYLTGVALMLKSGRWSMALPQASGHHTPALPSFAVLANAAPSLQSETHNRVRRVLLQLMEQRDAHGRYVVSFKNHWIAIYRVLVDRCGYPSSVTQFCRAINDLGVQLRVPCVSGAFRECFGVYAQPYSQWSSDHLGDIPLRKFQAQLAVARCLDSLLSH